MIGEQIRQYRIVSRLGAGGMGEVFLAEDERLGRKVALKFLAADLSKDDQALERFRNEARLSAGLSHPNIASIHGFEEHEDRWFHVHEYVEGETLEQIIRRGPMPIDAVRAVAVDLARGLAHAHSRGVIHRDLKPANVIVTPDGTAKILDFGLARRSGSAGPTLPGVALGTVAYMSPEQVRGEVVDHRCDLWALGALLQEALTGQPPFSTTEIPAQLHRILSEEPTPLSELRAETPDDLRHVVTGCLRKDRSERFASAEEILGALGLSSDLRQVPAAAPAGPSRPNWPWIGLGVAAIAALVVVGAVGLGFFDSGNEGAPATPESVAQNVTVEDEFGATVTQPIPSASYRRRVTIFFADEVRGGDQDQWLARGLPELVSVDLLQSPFVVTQTPFEFVELMRREGHPDGLDMPRALQRKIAREQMATEFVTYQITVNEDGALSVTQTVHETESGRELASEDLRGDDLFALADQVSAAIRTDLDLPEVLADDYPDLPVSEISTESVEAWQHYIAGVVALAEGTDYENAADQFKAAVTADSTFALAHMYRFVASGFTQDFAEMKDSAEAAMEYLYRLPQKLQFAMKANYYINVEQDSDKALALTRMWAQLHPEDESAFRQLAMFHMLRNEKEEQVAALEEVLRIDPADFNTLQTIGNIYRDMGRYDEAAKWFERFVEVYPTRASGLIELAQLQVDMGNRDRAREVLDRALLLEDRNRDARLLLSEIEAREGNPVAAASQLDAAMQAAVTPLERAGVYGDLADLAERQGRIREAIEHAESQREALAETLPVSQVVIRTLGDRRLYALIGEEEEGLARARADRLELVPMVRGAAGLGLIPLFTELGQTDSARVYLGALREFVDTYKFEMIRPVLFTFEARISEAEGNYAEALDRLEAAMEGEAPGRSQLHLRAELLRKTGRLEEAEATLDELARLDPSHPLFKVERARLHLTRDRPADARAALEEAMKSWSGADEDYTRMTDARDLLESIVGGR